MRISVDASPDPAAYPFHHELRTRFAETDAMGIIHHGAYAAYLEEARIAYLRALDRPYVELHDAGIDLTVLEVFVQFRRPLRFDEMVHVGVSVAASTRATFQLAYCLSVDGQCRSTAVTAHGAVDRDGRPQRLPSWFADLVA